MIATYSHACPTLFQVIACENARIDLDEVFGKDAQGFVAHLNTEGHHRGAVAAARSLAQEEVYLIPKCKRILNPGRMLKICTSSVKGWHSARKG
jgi:hypothetical protein